MSKWKRHSVLGLAVLLAVACSKSETESDAAAPGSDQTEISGNRSGRTDVALSSAGEAIENYLNGLEELVEIARNTTDEASANENAPIFEQKARELNELGEAMSGIDPAELRSEFMDEHSKVTQLTAELGKEMVRISTDPELVMIMSNAMRAYRGQ
jgi:hypothetical protein